MSKFYIQSGYDGKEVGALLFNYPKEEFKYSARDPYDGEIPVGTVEFVEEIIGIQKPDYYPQFLSPFFHRKIWLEESKIKEACFIKPADRHKRFEAKVYSPIDSCLRWVREENKGPYWCSEIVQFDNEWRYYVANGQILASYWYQGNNEREAPDMDIMFPADFCGAVDFGACNGEMTLVENNLPYACGWYGPYSEGKVYGEWLEKGWKFMLDKIR